MGTLSKMIAKLGRLLRQGKLIALVVLAAVWQAALQLRPGSKGALDGPQAPAGRRLARDQLPQDDPQAEDVHLCCVQKTQSSVKYSLIVFTRVKLRFFQAKFLARSTINAGSLDQNIPAKLHMNNIMYDSLASSTSFTSLLKIFLLIALFSYCFSANK